MNRLPIATVGDIGRTRDVQLGDWVNDTFTVIDFAGLVSGVVAHVTRRGASPVTLAASFEDESTGLIRVQLGLAGEWLPTLVLTGRADEQDFEIEYEVTFANSTVETWGPDILPVRRQFA